jgi:hypothetical protein
MNDMSSRPQHDQDRQQQRPDDDGVVEALENPTLDASGGMGMAASGTAIAAISAEIDKQIATAKRWPRPDDRTILQNRVLPRVTLTTEVAEACIYSLPRGNKNIEGPSIRLAETLFQSWGNCRVASEYLGIDRQNGLVLVRAAFFDLETNALSQAVEPRRITNRSGRLFTPDMISMTAKAAAAIAKRNAILGGISAGVVRESYHAAFSFATGGDEKEFEARKVKALKGFADRFGIAPPDVFKLLQIEDEAQMRPRHLPILRGFFNAMVQGEESYESLMRMRNPAAQDFETVSQPLRDDPPRDVHVDREVTVEATDKQKVQGHTAEVAAADRVIDTTGQVIKDRHADLKPAAADPAKTEQAAKPEVDKQQPGLALGETAEPTNNDEYQKHAEAWIAEATTATSIDQRWKSEKALRQRCKVLPDTLEHLEEVRAQRLAAIKK